MDSMPYAGRSRPAPGSRSVRYRLRSRRTAIATGVKTFNGAVGIDVDENPVPTVLERARDAGKATGLVTNSQVTDALRRPSAPTSQIGTYRAEIARQYIEESKPDVILGRGEDYTLVPRRGTRRTPRRAQGGPRGEEWALKATWSKRHGTSLMST